MNKANQWITKRAYLGCILAGAAALTAVHLALAKSPLVIQSMHSDPAPKKAFQTIVEDFKKENPDIDVKLNTVDHESYKVQIRTWLPNNPPDVATWFAGNRAKFFVEKGLIEPIDDVWRSPGASFSKSAENASVFQGKHYLLPATYYQWGVFYRKDLFQQHKLVAPNNWHELTTLIKKLNAAKITPFTIGLKQGWPAAAWFDFLNLRTQGYKSYMELLDGKASYESAGVSEAMKYWKELIELKAFPSTANAMTWQEAAALLWQGKAAMYLMGNFLVSDLPKGMEDKIGFFRFPTINDKVVRAEVAPIDVYFIPSKAKNKKAAKKFLTFLAKPSTQTKLSQMQSLLPANSKAKVDPENSFLVQGKALLEAADYVTQFYDRDANPQVARVGMNGFVEFMSFPKRGASVVKKMERTRKRVHR